MMDAKSNWLSHKLAVAETEYKNMYLIAVHQLSTAIFGLTTHNKRHQNAICTMSMSKERKTAND